MNELERFALSDDGDEGYTTHPGRRAAPRLRRLPARRRRADGLRRPARARGPHLPRRRARRGAARAGRRGDARDCARVLDAIERSARSGRLGGGAMTVRVANAPLQLRRVRDDRRDRLRGPRPRRTCSRRSAPRATPAPTSGRPATSARATCCAERLDANGLEVVGGFVPMRFSDAEGFDEDARPAPHARPLRRRRRDRRAARALRRGRARARSPTRAAAARTPRCASTTRAGARSPTTSRAPPDAARERGYEPVFHHHTSTYVEGVPEIERFLEDTDVALLLDSGHLARRGRRPGGGAARLGRADRRRPHQGRAARRARRRSRPSAPTR